jgi:hypothetical protein
MPFDLVADTDCVCFTIDKEIFIIDIGGIDALQKIAQASGDIKKLKGVPILSDTIQVDNTRVLTYLASCINDEKYLKGHSINIEGFKIDSPALYLVRGGSNGKILITNKHGRNEIIGVDYIFGEDQLLSDTKGGQMM